LGFAAQVRVAPPALVPVRATDALLVVRTLPPASGMATTGWVANVVLTALLERGRRYGWVGPVELSVLNPLST